MTNLAGIPVRQKAPKAKPNPAYLDAVRGLPCVICTEWGMPQNSPTEAHHVKSGRFSQVKTPDEQAIPLCHSHHHRMRDYPGDVCKIGFHNAQATWESLYGPDFEFTARTQDKLAHLLRREE